MSWSLNVGEINACLCVFLCFWNMQGKNLFLDKMNQKLSVLYKLQIYSVGKQKQVNAVETLSLGILLFCLVMSVAQTSDQRY